MSNSSQNTSQGVSPSISAVDTGIKAAMALSGALTSGIESAYLPALEALGLSGMACLPISKQLDPVVGVDCHIMIPDGPLPNPYIGLLLNPKDFLAVAEWDAGGSSLASSLWAVDAPYLRCLGTPPDEARRCDLPLLVEWECSTS